MSQTNIKNFLKVIFAAVILFAAVSMARAGNLDSPGSPAATGYTLSDIYNRLTTNQTAAEGNHNLSPAANPASTFRTLKEIYEAIPTILPETVKLGTSYLGIAGTLTPDGGTASTADLFSGKTAHLTNDWNLDTGALNLACNVSAFDGTANLVSDAYDGSGNGSNRWCVTDSGDAAAGDIRSGKTAWVDGAEISGSADIYPYGDTDAAEVLTSADAAGTYDATNLNAGTVKNGTAFGVGLAGNYPSAAYPLNGDTGADDATASEICGGYEAWQKTGGLLTGTLAPDADTIGSGNTICGVDGTLLKDEYNGSASSGDYPQSVGGVDDYNDEGSVPEDSYVSDWTSCDSGNDYCGTGDSTYADAKDNSTNLVWSKWLDSGATHTWFWANNCKYPNGLPGDDGTCNTDGEVACKCVKLTTGEGKTGCEDIGDGNWRLPYQKELMQAYIDGSWGNLSSAGSYYWSATTASRSTHRAWITYLYSGYTNTSTKTSGGSYRVRCVRAPGS